MKNTNFTIIFYPSRNIVSSSKITKLGKVLKEHPAMKMFLSISGTNFKDESICEVAYKHKIKVKSVHLIGEKDWLKLPSEELASAFHEPLIIRHPQGHTVPRLDEVATEELRCWVDAIVSSHERVGDAEAKENITQKMAENIENELENSNITLS
ncbi:uncharacterized protein LOC111470131 [Cucurbita maxima]|uniref:Uncharacterized protein LOC111470131 n=1 Tax=Cucurbita maxima TaxID=3661 RepID=A0A6J1I8F2_CUCMA|nr:uncharacterized protein LOC111470131 [Cucurbita maxima]